HRRHDEECGDSGDATVGAGPWAGEPGEMPADRAVPGRGWWWDGRLSTRHRRRRTRGRIPTEDQPPVVIDDDDRAVGDRLDPADHVERVVRLDQRERSEDGTLEIDPADRRAIVEREPVRPKVDDQATDADQRADV